MAMSGVVYNRFPEIAAKFPVQLHDAVVQMTEIIQELAQARCPVSAGHGEYKGGFLRSSIVPEMIDEFSGTVTVGAYYGIYVEMGTRFMAAEPYFYPAVDEGRMRWENVLAAMVTFL